MGVSCVYWGDICVYVCVVWMWVVSLVESRSLLFAEEALYCRGRGGVFVGDDIFVMFSLCWSMVAS